MTLDAGKHDRSDTPVTVFLTVPEGLERATAVKLLDRRWKGYPGPNRSAAKLNAPQQGPLVRELDFILPQLKAGQSAHFTAEILAIAPAASSASDKFHWKDTPGDHDLLSFGDRPVMQYMYHPLDDSTKAAREETYKVYHHVFDSTGKRLLTKGPARPGFASSRPVLRLQPSHLRQRQEKGQCLGMFRRRLPIARRLFVVRGRARVGQASIGYRLAWGEERSVRA